MRESSIATRDRWLPLLALTLLTLFTVSYFPLDILRTTPANGGDTGSHYWPLVTLLEYVIPNFDYPAWNPGNLAGEAHLLHNFPLPFLLMAVLALVLPTGMAFNIGSLFPLLLFPISVFVCVRRMRFPAPAGVTAAAISALFMLQESFTMWGGNALSVLAGQFAHMWAFCFLFFALGELSQEITSKRLPVRSSLLVAAVILSHAYVALGLAFFFPLFWLLAANRRQAFQQLVATGLLAGLLSSWHLIPMISHQPWTTPLPMEWGVGALGLNLMNPQLWMALLLGLLGFVGNGK
jgi:hypothetical protein